MARSHGIQLKSPDQIRAMRRAGLVVAETLALLREAVQPGVTTAELDVLAEKSIRDAGAVPSFLGYHGFPRTICTSVNDEVVHGIPGERMLEAGDILSIDCGAIVEGWHGDAAISVAVGEVSSERIALMRACEEALAAGIAAARVGGRLTDISAAVEATVRSRGRYGIVEDYVGHGIGTEMHQEPSVPNYGRPGKGPRLVAGMVLAIEPMITLGAEETEVLEDDWTVVSADGSVAAHFEHTVALTDDGPWVLTALDGDFAAR